MKKVKPTRPIDVTIDEETMNDHFQELDRFAKAIMNTPYVKAMIADKEAGN
jgi:hypothetical protein